jgi:hypothetical protein
MKSENLWPCSQEPATWPYFEPDESTPFTRYLLKCSFTISLPPTHRSSKWSLPFQQIFCMHFSSLLVVLQATPVLSPYISSTYVWRRLSVHLYLLCYYCIFSLSSRCCRTLSSSEKALDISEVDFSVCAFWVVVLRLNLLGRLLLKSSNLRAKSVLPNVLESK